MFLPVIASPAGPMLGLYPASALMTAGSETLQDTKAGKLTVADLEEMLGNLKNKVLDEDEILQWIRERGVDFYADKAALNEFVKRGATKRIIDALMERAAKRITTGSLALRCVPAECEIKLNDKSVGTATNGQLVLVALPVGDVTVEFAKEGYISQQKAARVTAGEASEVSVTLEPNVVTQADNGKPLLALMLKALGMDSEAKDFPPWTGSGSVTCYADGKQSDWNFDLGVGSSTLIEMHAESSTGNLRYVCSGQKCNQRKKGHFAVSGSKGVQPAVAATLETNLRAFSQYHLGPVLLSLLSPSVRLTAPTADAKPQGDQQLRAELPDSVYKVTLGPDLLPAVVDYESKMGLGSGLRILFGNYGNITGDEKQKNGSVFRYPKHTTIRLPDGEHHGVEVRLDKVEGWSAFKASDFSK